MRENLIVAHLESIEEIIVSLLPLTLLGILIPKGYRECSTGSLATITLCSSTEKLVWADFGQVAAFLHSLTIFCCILWATVWVYLWFL